MVAYISKNASNKIISSLAEHADRIFLLPPHSALSSPVDSHADMLMLAVGDMVFVHSDYDTDGLCLPFKETVRVACRIGAKYPIDVPLNIAVVGKNVIANPRTASGEVLDHLEKMGMKLQKVSQGYAHCSTCIVSDNAIISADRGIISAAEEAGIDTLKISEGHISLPPYGYGFIGGASGSDGRSVYFCGSLSTHPDGEKIRKFCTIHGKSVIELSDGPLEDVGGIIFA